MKMSFFKKRDALILLVVLAVIAASVILIGGAGQSSPNYVLIHYGVNGSEVKKVPLGKEQIVRIEQDNGDVNEIEITKSGVRMHFSTCDNQDCVKQGEVTPENFRSRILSNWIVCLPNGVSVELISEEDGQ
jgi:hypothetical protein